MKSVMVLGLDESDLGDRVRDAAKRNGLDAVVIGPLMHGGGQWLTLIALYSGSKAILFTERSFDAERVLDLIHAERATSVGLIGDAMDGDETLFTRADSVDVAWQIVQPILKSTKPVQLYEPGTWGPKEAQHGFGPPYDWIDPTT